MRSPEPSPEDLRLLDPDGIFQQRLRDDRVTLERLSVSGPAAELERVVHQLAGAAGTFGFAEIGEIAIGLDDAFVAARTSGAARPSVARLLRALDAALGRSA